MTFTLTPSGAGSGASFELLGTDHFGGLSLTTGTGTSNGQVGVLTPDGADLVSGAEVIPSSPAIEFFLLDPTTIGAGVAIGGAFNASGFPIVMSNVSDNTTYNLAYNFQP